MSAEALTVNLNLTPVPVDHNYKMDISYKNMTGGLEETATLTMYEDDTPITSGVSFQIIDPTEFTNAHTDGNTLYYDTPVDIATQITIQGTYGEHIAQS
jgi:hypothetical protein